jgi:DNA-binding MarR family transcriptional regulator
MVIMERLESILANLGMDDAMTRVFTYLASQKKGTIEDIFSHTTLSRGSVSMALDELVAGGSVEREGEYFTVEDVQKALLTLLPSRFEELKAEIYSYSPPRPREACAVVEAFRDELDSVPSFVARNMDAALNNIHVISRSMSWLDDESLNSAMAAVQRGVIIRVISSKYPELESDTRALVDAGVDVRVHGYAEEVEFIMVDRELIAFAITEPPKVTRPAYLGLLIRNAEVCEKILQHIFDPAWEDAEIKTRSLLRL